MWAFLVDVVDFVIVLVQSGVFEYVLFCVRVVVLVHVLGFVIVLLLLSEIPFFSPRAEGMVHHAFPVPHRLTPQAKKYRGSNYMVGQG